LAEVAALDLRSTNRHTRVPAHLRSGDAEREEYQGYLERLRQLLIHKRYADFLANYNQVEFIGPREVLRETALLQQIVVALEVRLARHALASSQATWRHGAVLLQYSQSPEDHERAAAILPQGLAEGRIKAQLLHHFAVSSGGGEPTPAIAARGPEAGAPGSGGDTAREIREAVPFEPASAVVAVAFDGAEAARIESILGGLVKMQGEAPLFFNPEDYEHELLRRLRQVPGSPLFEVADRHGPEEVDQLLWSYQCCYRKVIDGTLQREILTQHHAPELAELFTGEGLKRLKALAVHYLAAIAAEAPENRDVAMQAELERYLMDRCFPDLPHSPMFYLEFFRAWVAPDLIREVTAEQGGN
jgi:hypothetical protein